MSEAQEIIPPAEEPNEHDLRLLEPKAVRLFRTGGNAVRLTVENSAVLKPDRTFLRVKIARAFPFSDPERFIGFRDDRDKDLGLLETLEGIDAESRGIIREELDRLYFLPRVTRVVNIKEEGGTSTWEVETDRGQRTYIVQGIREAVQNLTATRVLVTDRDGNRFEIPDLRAVDGKTLAVLQRAI